jgi:hypothetical protein
MKRAGNPMKGDVRQRQPGEEPEAKYANYFHVGHNAFEVMLEFGQHYEDASKPQMHTRIVTAPAYAEALCELLRKALAEYKKTFGSIASRKTNE